MMILMGAVFAAMARSSYKSARDELNTLEIVPAADAKISTQASTHPSPQQ